MLCCKQNAQSFDTIISPETVISIGDSIIKNAKLHIGKPYIYNSLDVNKIEQLVVNYKAFDCTTFIESVIAETVNRDSINDEIRKMRYRNGIIDGYTSRIHYFTEWIKENEKRGLITNITDSIKCKRPYDVEVSYMSRYKKKYPLISNGTILQEIIEMEKNVSNMTLNFIPKLDLNKCDTLILDGDIIAITTLKKGLDISHLGFAHWKDGKLHFLHASSDYKRVVITLNTLQEYLMKNKTQTGVVVLRLKY